MHVVRNALDHGIEPEPERASRGKPSAGRLVLRSRRGDQPLAIEIIDDGRGVDWQAVTRRAKELGGPMPSDDPPVSALFFGRGSLGWHFPGRRSSGATAPDSSASAAAPGRAAQRAPITI